MYVCMYVYVCVCMYVCVCVCMYVCMYVCVYVCTYVLTCVCMYVYVCVYVCVYVYTYVLTCVCMYYVRVNVCIYICMCVCMYVCMHAYYYVVIILYDFCFLLFFSCGISAHEGLGRPVLRSLYHADRQTDTHTHTHTHTHSSTPRAIDRLIVQPSVQPLPTQHTTNTTDDQPYRQRVSYPRSQQSYKYVCRPTAYTDGQRDWLRIITSPHLIIVIYLNGLSVIIMSLVYTVQTVSYRGENEKESLGPNHETDNKQTF